MPRGIPKSGFRNTKRRRERECLAGGVTPFVESESRFTINERFGFVSDMVTMLAHGVQASVVVSGPGGLGKSYTVLDALNKAGLVDISALEDLPVGFYIDTGKTFRVVRGYSTPKGLYRILYENRDSVVVFDDCDSVLKDPVSLNILKAALDSYSRRFISWRADIKDDDLPTSFEFTGRVVFISNLPNDSLDQAIISRSLAVDLSMSSQQKIDRMWYLLDQPGFMPDYPREYKIDALNLISSFVDRVKDLSLRSLIQGTKIRKTGGPKWGDLCEYALCG